MKLYIVMIGYNDSHYVILPAKSGRDAVKKVRELPGSKLTDVARFTASITERGSHALGKFFRGPDGTIYRCVAYDWRTGWWMMDEKTGEMMYISERAIGRTFHLYSEGE